MTMLLAPRCEALQRAPELLAGCSPLEVIFPLAVLAPPKLESQKPEAHFSYLSVPTERDDPCLGARQLQAAFLQPSPQHVVEAFRICLVCERADEIVCVANQTRFASTVPFDHFFKPYSEHVVQEHIGEDG